MDYLLNISELNGIQWVPGAGAPGVDCPRWFPLYKRIQEADKLLILPEVAKENIKKLLGNLSSKGLLISTSCGSEKEITELMDKLET